MASSYVIVDALVGASPASQIDTFARVPPGYMAHAIDYNTKASNSNAGAGMFVYCRGSDATTNGQWVMISCGSNSGFGGVSAVLLASANSTNWWPIGVLAGVLTGTGQFGWVQVQGLCDYASVSNTAVAINARLALASTAGQVGSVTALGSRIIGVNVPVSFTSSQTSLTVYLQFPQLIGVTASN